MKIQDAITKAVEGGYMDGIVGSVSSVDPERYYANRRVWFRGDAVNDDRDINLSVILLDPLFWQALGKSMGWDKGQQISFRIQEDIVSKKQTIGLYSVKISIWEYYWWDLIHHLAEGGTIEDYFEKLNP